jgi:cobalt-precorrin-6B (C15)-methyltransferase
MLGIKDDDFIRGKIPMTKQEIRILTLVKAKIEAESIVLDIGAGTGSLSIEAALLAKSGHVYAVERKHEGIDLICRNAKKFTVENLTAIEGEAPMALNDIPPCDVILIGGSGKHLQEILEVSSSLLKVGGRLILNCITLQTLYEAISYMREHKEKYRYEAVQVQVNRLNPIGAYDMAEALNPIHIISCEKISL